MMIWIRIRGSASGNMDPIFFLIIFLKRYKTHNDFIVVVILVDLYLSLSRYFFCYPDPEVDPDPANWYGSNRIRIRNTAQWHIYVPDIVLASQGQSGSLFFLVITQTIRVLIWDTWWMIPRSAWDSGMFRNGWAARWTSAGWSRWVFRLSLISWCQAKKN